MHGIGPLRPNVTHRTVRIASKQVTGLLAMVLEFRGCASTVARPGCLRDRLPRSFGRVAEWQTRWLQVPVSFGTWGFKSPFAHREEFYELQALRSRSRYGS